MTKAEPDYERDTKAKPKTSAAKRVVNGLVETMLKNESRNEKDIILDYKGSVGSSRFMVNMNIFEFKIRSDLNENELKTCLRLFYEHYTSNQAQLK